MSRSKAVVLPKEIVTKADIARLFRELSEVSEYAHQASLRKQKFNALDISDALNGYAAAYSFDVTDAAHRKELLAVLAELRTTAPQIHLSFAVMPPRKTIETIVEWLRANIAPTAVVTVGLDPSIVGGCIVRTANKVFNFGFNTFLDASTAVIAREVAAL